MIELAAKKIHEALTKFKQTQTDKMFKIVNWDVLEIFV